MGYIILFRTRTGLAVLLNELDSQDDGIWTFPTREGADACVEERPGLKRLPVQIVKLEI